MIMNFTVENFRSIKDPATLSAIALNSKTRQRADGSRRFYVVPDSEIAAPYPIGHRRFGILPLLAIFGPNASGKSNLLMALDYLLQVLANRSHRSDADTRLPAPFALDPVTARAPTRFVLGTALDEALYWYSLLVTLGGAQPQIWRERLEYLPSPPKRTRLLFERNWNESERVYTVKWGDDLSNRRSLKRFAQSRHPFLSQVVGQYADRDETEPSLAPLARWLWSRWPGVGLGYEDLDRQIGFSLGQEEPPIRERVVELVRRFDTGVVGIDIEPVSRTSDEQAFPRPLVFVRYASEGNMLRLPLGEISTGTRELIGLAFRMFYTFEQGTLLLVDDLGTHFHPHLLHAIVRLFQDPSTNPKRAQLILASHDVTLLSEHQLRRDQIWFTERRIDGSTTLFPLSDFKIRNDLAIDKAYLAGRFDGVPILPAEWDLLPLEEASPA